MQKTIRAFIAIEINDRTREELSNVQSALKKHLAGSITWVKPANIHLTLRFLGDIKQEQVELLKPIMGIVAKNSKHFNMDLGVLGIFPSISTPRVLWAGIHFGFDQVCHLNALLAKQLEDVQFASGEKYFHPHLTLARIKTLECKRDLKQLLQEHKPREIFSTIRSIVLFESKLSSKGADYTKLFEAKFS